MQSESPWSLFWKFSKVLVFTYFNIGKKGLSGKHVQNIENVEKLQYFKFFMACFVRPSKDVWVFDWQIFEKER